MREIQWLPDEEGIEQGWWAIQVSNLWPLPCEGEKLDF